MNEEKQQFKKRVHQWANTLNVPVNSLTLRPMKRKWASCSSDGNLNFNVELIGQDDDVINYVIVHELLHFSVPNHGPLWKSLMTAHLGDYRQAEEKLAASPSLQADHLPR